MHSLGSWINGVEKATEGGKADEEELAVAVQGVRQAAAGLKACGAEEIGVQIEDLVTVKVQATGDMKTERKAVTVLVGAEEHRARLEELLKRRRLIAGA